MSDDNFFTALGPNDLYGYGFATDGAQIIYGGLLEGSIVQVPSAQAPRHHLCSMRLFRFRA